MGRFDKTRFVGIRSATRLNNYIFTSFFVVRLTLFMRWVVVAVKLDLTLQF